MRCRHCACELDAQVIDLGSAPPSNAYLHPDHMQQRESWFPLRVHVCQQCWLVQTQDFARAEELFSEDYAYFSSFSASWLEHAKHYVARMVDRFRLGADSLVVEVAANDGYLLQYVQERGIPALGIEPTASTAAAARAKGIRIEQVFFGVETAKQLLISERPASLMAANNVLAHVPDINDFVSGFAVLLATDGVATFEFPHVVNLIEQCQFDTIYHEHYSYLSLTAVRSIFERNGLDIFDVEKLPTHGGSLRVYAQRRDVATHKRMDAVAEILAEEENIGVRQVAWYAKLQGESERIKRELLKFLIACKESGRRVVGYGAAAKGNTLLNWCGIRPDLLAWVVDKNPAKAGKFLPGSRIPIVGENRIVAERPEVVLILPWNLSREISSQLQIIRDWGGSFVTAVPALKEW